MYSKCALVVDDSRTARTVLKHQLNAFDVVVESACDGNHALDLLQTYTPDVIFLDHIMPGPDGFEVLRRLKANQATRGIPVVMYTSQAAPVYSSEARSLGAIAVIPKNVTDEQLMEALDRAELYRLSAANDATLPREEPVARRAANDLDGAPAVATPAVSPPAAPRGDRLVGDIDPLVGSDLPEASNDAARPEDAGAPPVGTPAHPARRSRLVPLLLCALLALQGLAFVRDQRQQASIADLQQRVAAQSRALPALRAQLEAEQRAIRVATSRQVEFLMSVILSQLQEEWQVYQVNAPPEAPADGVSGPGGDAPGSLTEGF